LRHSNSDSVFEMNTELMKLKLLQLDKEPNSKHFPKNIHSLMKQKVKFDLNI